MLEDGGAASCKMGACGALTHGRWSVAAQSWSAAADTRLPEAMRGSLDFGDLWGLAGALVTEMVV